MKVIYLYSTPGCHLCDLAKDILWPLLNDYPLRMEEIDIAESDELLERYGVRIPVVAQPHSLNELGWPFDTGKAQVFLRQVCEAS